MITFGNLQESITILENYDQVHHVLREMGTFVFTYPTSCPMYSNAHLARVWLSRGFPISMTWVSWEHLVNFLQTIYFCFVNLKMHSILLRISGFTADGKALFITAAKLQCCGTFF